MQYYHTLSSLPWHHSPAAIAGHQLCTLAPSLTARVMAVAGPVIVTCLVCLSPIPCCCCCCCCCYGILLLFTTGCRQRLVSVLNVTILLDSVASAPQQPPGCEQTLHANWASGMDAGRADAHLCAQPKPEAICKPGGCIVKDTGTVHASQEILCFGLVACISETASVILLLT